MAGNSGQPDVLRHVLTDVTLLVVPVYQRRAGPLLAGLRLLGPARLGRARLGLPGLARVLVVTETDVPVRSVLAVLRARHDGRIALGSFGAVTAGCEGAWPELVAALAGSAKPSRPTVTPALARSIEDAFFMSPLRVH